MGRYFTFALEDSVWGIVHESVVFGGPMSVFSTSREFSPLSSLTLGNLVFVVG